MKKLLAILLSLLCALACVGCFEGASESQTTESTATANTISYKVEYYYEAEDGSFVIDASLTENKTGEEGQTVTAGEKNKSGYVFDESNANNVLTAVLENDGVVLKRYYKISAASVSYTIEYYFQNENGDFEIDASLTEVLVAELGDIVTIPDKVKAGYIYDAENGNNVLSGMLSGEGLVLKRYYKSYMVTVTFDTTTNDIGVSFASQTIEANSKVTRPDDPKKDASDISHWTLNGQVFDFDTPITEDITLVAVPVQYSPIG